MDPSESDIFTTHYNDRYKKKSILQAAMGFVGAVIFLSEYLKSGSGDEANTLALIGSVLCFGFFLVMMAIAFAGKHPLRVTQQGIVFKNLAFVSALIRWDRIAGLGVHPKRNTPCLLLRDTKTGAAQPMAINWSMIEEPPQEVMAALREQLRARGHRFDGDDADKKNLALPDSK